MGNAAGVRRDFDALEKRRFAAMQLLDEGMNQSEVARRVKVARQTVARWAQECRSKGKRALKKAGRARRKPLLKDKERKRLVERLQEGPERLGYETPLWTCPRVGAPDRAGVRDLVPQGACLENSGESRLESATAHRTCSGTQRGRDPHLEKEEVACG